MVFYLQLFIRVVRVKSEFVNAVRRLCPKKLVGVGRWRTTDLVGRVSRFENAKKIIKTVTSAAHVHGKRLLLHYSYD